MLQGKRALITGSTSGIGLGIARALAAQGCDILLHGLGDSAEIQDICEILAAEANVQVDFSQANLVNRIEIEQLFDSVVKDAGGIDILVNNAGIQHTAPIEKFPAEKWDQIIAVNLSAAFHTSRLALPTMQEKSWGRIINIASVHGLVASTNKSAYVAAKHGIVGLTKAISLETAGTGITCNAICPGWTRTELIEPQIVARATELGVDLESGARDLLGEKQPSGQFVTVEQLGQIAILLCSDSANQITGAAIPVDGGWTAQ